MGGGSHRTARWGRAAAAAAALAAGWLLAEAGAWVGLSVVDRTPWSPSWAALATARPATGDELVTRALGGNRGRPAETPWQSLHPYLGFVVDPAASALSGWRGIGTYGMPGSGGGPSLGAGTLRVGIFGGSVAMDLWTLGHGVVAHRLEEATGRPVAVDNFALSAYKQPQQLMLLNYALVRGERFDVVVELDGFNEAALPYDGVPSGLDPTYPFRWNERVETTFAPGALQALVAARTWEVRRRRLARLAASEPWRRSALCHLAWRVADGTLARRERRWRLAWEEEAAAARAFRTHGAEPPASEEALFALEVEVWERSSRLMDALVASAGGRYFHFLQPNQYDEGAKPIGAAEAAVALGPAGPGSGGWAVRRVYPRLSAAGRRLRRDGVRFHDLRRLFADHPEPLYSDDCCHLTAAGTGLLARRIARTVARELAEEGTPQTGLPPRTR